MRQMLRFQIYKNQCMLYFNKKIQLGIESHLSRDCDYT